MIGKEILILADGDFSFTTAYLKLLSEKSTQSCDNDYYDIISSELKVSNPGEIKKNILSTLKIDSKALSLKICEIDAHAISPKTFGEGKRFDEIILNFPTPFLRGVKLEINRFFEQIITHNLLKEDGVLKLTYWQRLYDNSYEDAYEITVCASGFETKSGINLI